MAASLTFADLRIVHRDPSEDAIYDLIQDLAHPDNTFITIEPPPNGSPWHIVISLLPDQTFEVEYKDLARREHRVETETHPDQIAHDATVWLADTGRYYDGPSPSTRTGHDRQFSRTPQGS